MINSITRVTALAVAACACVLQANSLEAIDSANSNTSIALDTVTITASSEEQLTSLRPAQEMDADALERSRASSLGDTLSQQPGIQNAGFGSAVGRPVIRGMSGGRVAILQDGLEAADASSVSPDHAVAVETDHATKIEVLRGPAALIYSADSAGGVVNVSGVTLSPGDVSDTGINLGYDTVSTGRFAALSHKQTSERWGWHVGASERRTEDYRVPSDAGEVHREDDGSIEAHDAESKYLDNSDIEYQRQIIAGGSYFGDSSVTSFNIGYLASKFGLPGHSHEEHEEHEEEEGDEEHEEHEEGEARVDLERLRLALNYNVDAPFAWASRWDTRISWTDYEHSEGHEEAGHEEHEEEEAEEEEHEQEHGMTTFSKTAWNLRTELQTVEKAGRQHVFGASAAYEDFSAEGGEALMPSTTTEKVGVFWLGEQTINDLLISFATRFDNTSMSPETPDEVEDVCGFAPSDVKSQDFFGASGSAGVTYFVNNDWTVTASAASVVRAPDAEALYSCGPHESTFSFDVGNPELDRERAFNLDAGVAFQRDAWALSLAVYRNRVNNYIYASPLAEAGVIQEADELPVYEYTQNDAILKGAEIETSYAFSNEWSIAVLADRTRGTLMDGGYLPRMPTDRVGLTLNRQSRNWAGFARWMTYADQDRTADYDGLGEGAAEEIPTAGFNLLSAGVSYRWVAPASEYRIGIKGENLLNEVVRYHTSFVKDAVPGAGRNINLSLAVNF